MKKTVLLLGMCVLQTLALAQSPLKTNDRLDKQVLAFNLTGADMATVEMKKELQLSDTQFAQIAEMNQALYEQLELAGVATMQDPIKRSELVRSLLLENDKALQQVLSQQQLRYYLELEGRQNTRFVSENDN